MSLPDMVADAAKEVIEEAVKAEREACAKLAETTGAVGHTSRAIAKAIRARNSAPHGQEPK